jgi:aspartyl aminopeptidase
VAVQEAYNGAMSFDSIAMAMVTEAARQGGAEIQFYCVKNGPPSGGTIGPKVEAGMGIRTIDIGHVMQAMHSHREIMAWKDVISEWKLLRALYEKYEAIRAYIGM